MKPALNSVARRLRERDAAAASNQMEPPRVPLTTRQWRVLKLIQKHISMHGYPPTRTEICKAMGFNSPNAAECHLRALERRGAIEMAPGKARGIKLIGSWIA